MTMSGLRRIALAGTICLTLTLCCTGARRRGDGLVWALGLELGLAQAAGAEPDGAQGYVRLSVK
jgi:hypothetical protein